MQALRVPRASESQISRQSAHEGGQVVSPMHWPPLSHSKYFWYSLLLAAEHIISIKNSNDIIRNRNRDLPAHSAVRQLTVPPRAPIMDIVLSPRQVLTARRTYQKNVMLNIHYIQNFKIFINMFCDADAPSLCHKWKIFILQKYFNMTGGNGHLKCKSTQLHRETDCTEGDRKDEKMEEKIVREKLMGGAGMKRGR